MIPWNDEYKVGMKELDGQHLILFSIINQIDINIAAERTGDLIEDVLSALTAYVSYHFAFEEALMRQHGYPRLAEHIASHRRLSQTLDELAAGQRMTDVAQAVRIRKFAIDWLVDHIMQDDAEFADLVKAGQDVAV